MRVNTSTFTDEMLQREQQQRCFVENRRNKQHNTWLRYLFTNQGDNNIDNNSNENNSSIIQNDLDHKLANNSLIKFIIHLLNSSIFTESNDKSGICYYVDDSSKENFLPPKSLLSTKEANSISKGALNVERADSNNFNNHTFKINYNYIETSKSDLNNRDKLELANAKQQLFSLPHILLLILILIGIQDAEFCEGFTNPLRNDNIGLIGNHFSHQLSTITPNLQSPSYRNMMRQINNDPLIIMPSSQDSFTNDELGQPNLSDWTSKLSGAFSGGTNTDTLDSHIRSILVPRVSGTSENIKVREYIVNSLQANNYHIELDEFIDSTPIGNVKFANIIASSNPNACRQLVLACHYDSKMMNGFLGATDSAVPCAMLLKISETFSKQFRENAPDSLGLRFIFFDGEEAFDEWGPKDSLYGSRHLAERWEKQQAPAKCNVRNELSRIELFVLLDLIGAEDTSFVMYNIALKHHYNAMQRYEKAYLAKGGLTSLQTRRESMFKGRFVPLDFVEDDHVPFKKRGVPILSLLAHPFPKVWHTVEDNYKSIDFTKTKRVLHVLEEFVANYKKEAN